MYNYNSHAEVLQGIDNSATQNARLLKEIRENRRHLVERSKVSLTFRICLPTDVLGAVGL